MERGKLIFVNRFFYPDESATSQILTDLAVALASDGARVHVICSRLSIKGGAELPSETETYRGVAIHRVRTSAFGNRSLAGRAADQLSFYPGAFLKLLRLCASGDVVVVKTDPPLVSVALAPAVRLKRARLVNWLQDLYPEVGARLGIRFLKGWPGQMLAGLRNWSLRKAAMNVVIGERMREYLVGKGVSESRIAVIPNWADDEMLRPIDARLSAVRAEWGLAGSSVVVGYSGNLGRAHEADTVLGAARLLRGQEEISFLFVGGGREQERLRTIVEADALTNVLFREHQPKERLAEALAAADVHWLSLRPELEGLIVPSKFYGIAASGRPVIAVTAEDGEIARIVRTHGIGRVVVPGDAEGLAREIRELAGDRNEVEALGRKARQVLETHFSRASAIDRWKTLLAALGDFVGQSKGAACPGEVATGP